MFSFIPFDTQIIVYLCSMLLIILTLLSEINHQ